MSAVGDLAESITYTSINKGTYDVSTGLIPSSGTSYLINAIVSFDDNTMAGRGKSTIVNSTHTGEITVLFASKGLAFTPKTDDKVIRDGEAYIVSDIKKDPVGASYSLKLRVAG
jgi:hypothetical protein